MSLGSMDKYYNDIIDNLRLRIISQENRIYNLQNSEYKLETEIDNLKNELNSLKDKKLINSPNHILSYTQERVQD
jgi:chaperonin cofactor prefoldin